MLRWRLGVVVIGAGAATVGGGVQPGGRVITWISDGGTCGMNLAKVIGAVARLRKKKNAVVVQAWS